MVCVASVYIDVPVPCAGDEEACSAWRQNKRYTMRKLSVLLPNTIPTSQALF